MAVFGRRKSDEIHLTPDVSHIRNPNVAYEHSDVPVTPVLKFVGGLVVFFVVICVAMFLMFKVLETRAINSELKPSPLAREGADRLPPEPRLQMAPGWKAKLEDGQQVALSDPLHPDNPTNPIPDPNAEYNAVRKDWDEQLNNAGFIDQQAGTVHIPIEQAKTLYLQRRQQKTQVGGAQPQTTNGAAAREGERMPAASSAGRTAEQRIP